MEVMVTGLEGSLTVNVSCQYHDAVVVYTLTLSFFFVFPVVRCVPLVLSTSAPGGLTLQFSAPTRTIGTRAVYSCGSSYQLIGETKRVCEANGNWTGNEPRCEC